KEKHFVAGLLLLWNMIAGGCWKQLYGSAGGQLTIVDIGNKAGDAIDSAQLSGSFAKKMKKQGYQVNFKEYQNGSAMMQALASGKIDYGRVGDTPPVSALSSNTELTFVAAGGTRTKGSWIVVTKQSEITQATDLKGKKIAYTRGTSSQYMVLKTLKKLDLTTADVELVNMDTTSAAMAFAKGQIDAWATW